MSLAKRMSSLDTFLAYSVALEEEAAERHDELADMMDVHHNPDVAATFRKLAHYSRLHRLASSISRRPGPLKIEAT